MQIFMNFPLPLWPSRTTVICYVVPGLFNVAKAMLHSPEPTYHTADARWTSVEWEAHEF